MALKGDGGDVLTCETGDWWIRRIDPSVEKQYIGINASFEALYVAEIFREKSKESLR